MSKSEKLSRYINELSDVDSDEFKKAQKDQGGYVTAPLTILNWSTNDLAMCIMRFAFEEMEKVK